MKKFVKSVAAICAATILMGSVPIVSLGAGTDAKGVSIAPKEGIKAVKVTTEEATPFDGVVIYAVYEGQSLSSVEAKEFKDISSAQDGEVQFDKAYTKSNSKLFVWNSLSEMVPYNVTVVSEKVQISTAAKVEISGDTTAPTTLTATVSAINDSGFEDTTAFTYEWKKGEDTLLETGATITNAAEGNYTVTATYIGAGNYEGSTTTASPYIVSPAGDTREDITGDDTVSVSINASSQTAPATLTAQISAGEKELVAGDFTYVWSKDSSPISGGENGTLENAQAGEYTVIATVKSDNPDYKGTTAASEPVAVKAVYTVTFDSDGGTSVASAQVTDGETVSQPENPAKEHYDFADWYNGAAAYDFNTPVTDNITLKAHWTIKQYTVTFNTDGGNAIQAVTQDYNTTITLPTPNRDGYTFVKWNDGAADYNANDTYIITGNVTITASWTENQADTYTVAWKNGSETLETDSNVASGSHPSYDGSVPTKESADKTYIFTGWKKANAQGEAVGEIVNLATETITENTTYLAQFSESTRQYNATFRLAGGNISGNETDVVVPTDYNTVPQAPVPTRDGFAFVAWNPAVSAITADTNYTATWKVATPNITIDYVNEVLTGFGSGAYTIGGTSASLPILDGKLAIAADYFGKTINIVKKGTGDDADSEAQQLPVPARPAAPTSSDITVTQPTEIGGRGTISGVTDVMEYKKNSETSYAAGDGTPITAAAGDTYYVRYKAVAGESFASADYEVPAITAYTPDKEVTPSIEINYINETLTGFTAGATYTLTVDGTPVDITPDAAAISATAYIGKTISIVKKGNGTTTTDSEAQSLTVDARPAKPTGLGTQEETAANAKNGKITGVTTAMEYMLSTGDTWHDVEGTEIENLAGGTYYVRLKATSSAFASENATVMVATRGLETVIFKNEDGTVLDTQNLAIGATPVYSGTPTKAATAEYTYTFKGWSPEIATVTAGGAVYMATYTATKNKYTITWNIDGAETTEQLEYGATPMHTDPTKAATAEYTYTFKAWSPEITAVSKAQTYTATWNEVKNTYTVTWKNEDGTVLETDENVEYGTMPTYDGETPTKTSTDSIVYTFNTWTPAVGAIEGNTIYTAVYTASNRKYNVTFDLAGGTGTAEAQEIAYNSTAEAPADPTKTGYDFSGWSPTITTPITSDTKFTAQWTAVEYAITYKNTDGASAIDEADRKYTIEAAKTLPTITKTGHTFDGWYTAAAGGDKVETIPANSTGDKEYFAHWTINSYAITNNSATDDGTNHGTIALGGLDGDNKAEYNSTITVTPTADNGYELKKITVTGLDDITEADSETGEWQFTMPAADVTVTATFGKKAVKSVTVTGAARVQKGKTSDYTATVTATDDTDVTSVYESDITWSVDETSAAAETAISGGTLTVNKNQTDDITVKAAIGDKYGTATVTPTTQRPDALEIVAVTVPTNHSTTQGSAIDGDTATNYFSDRKPTYLTAELDGVKNVSSVEIYFFTAGRKYDFDIQTSVDGTYWDKAGTFQSSGAATNFETFEFTARNAKYVRYVGNGYESNTGNAIIEFEVYGSDAAAEEAVLLTISENQILTATNTENGYPASNAFDNDPSTRWNAGAATPQVLTVDLLGRRVVSAVEVLFRDPDLRSHKFTVEVSANGSTWTTVADYNNDDGIGKTLTSYDEGNRISFEPKTARYIRFTGYGLGAGNSGTYTGLREFRIYGTNDILPEPTQQTLTLIGASAEQSNNDGYARYAIDGKEDTRWAAMVDYSNDKTKENTITFDLAKTKCISAAEIYFYESANRNYQFDIWVSNDGTMWQKAGTYISSKQSKYESFEFEPINARYVQYAGRALGIDKSYNGFWEFRVYGFDEVDEKVSYAPTTSTTNLKAAYDEDSKTVTWDAFDGASYYTVEYQKYGVTQAVSDKLTECTYTDNAGGDYGYVVKGYKVTGELIAQSEMVGAENSAYYYVTADMNTVTTFNRVDIDWNGDAPSDYLVASSSDGVTWTKMDNNSTESNTVSSFSFEKPFYVYKDYNARYVRVISDTDISAAVISISKKTDVAPAGSSMLFQKADGTDIKSSNTVNVDIRLNVKNEWPSACLYWDVAEAKTYDFDEANIIIPLSNASDISKVEIGAYYAYPGDGQEFKRTSFAKNYKISYINSAEGTVNANSDGWQELESGDATGKGRLIANFDSVKATHVKFTMSGGEVKGANDNKIATFLSYIGVYTSDDIDSTSTSGSYTAGNE